MPRDPYRNFRFEVEIDGFTRAGFSKISGLNHNIDVTEYREGGDNETPKKLPGQSKFDPVVCERGLSNDHDFVRWIEQVYDVFKEGGQGTVEGWRKTLIVYLKDKAGVRVKKWTVLNCWPSAKGLGDFDANSSDVLLETLTLQNEGIKEELLAA